MVARRPAPYNVLRGVVGGQRTPDRLGFPDGTHGTRPQDASPSERMSFSTVKAHLSGRTSRGLGNPRRSGLLEIPGRRFEVSGCSL